MTNARTRDVGRKGSTPRHGVDLLARDRRRHPPFGVCSSVVPGHGDDVVTAANERSEVDGPIRAPNRDAAVVDVHVGDVELTLLRGPPDELLAKPGSGRPDRPP